MEKKFIVYKSSAGSGKTHTLVREYLALALSEPEKYRNILAITFTNKAADEMKQRVLSYLQQLTVVNKNGELRMENGELEIENGEKKGTPSAKDSILVSELAKTLNLTEEEVSKRAKGVLTSILHNYSNFAIGTIDSFVHKIIRTFAHDLYIPSDFDVEMDTDKLLDETVDILISRVGSDEKLTKILVEFIESKTDDERSWHIENDIKNLARSLLKEDGQIYLDKLRDISMDDYFEIIRQINTLLKTFESEVSNLAEKACQLILNHSIDNESFFYGKTGIGSYFKQLRMENGELRMEKIKPNSRVIQTIDDDKWTSGKADPSDKAAIDSIKEQLKSYYLNIQEIKDNDYPKYVLFQVILQNIYPLAVLNEIKKIIDTIKTENNILHISEFNKIISGIVLKEPVPFIYERTGEKYKHFLIDEFQDTSLLQWQNLLPLIDNSLSENNLNMVVGDGKQSIYRWRNGDVEQFMNLPKIAGSPELGDGSWEKKIALERQLNLERQYEGIELDKNYRSGKVIVEFNNDLFSFVSKNINEDFRSIYDKVVQKHREEKTGGYVHVEFVNEIQDTRNETQDTSIKTQDTSNKTQDTSIKNQDNLDFEDLNLIRIKKIINELKKDNFRLKDIAVLCRSNRNASLTAQYLLTEGIDVVSSESLLLSKSPAVSFIIACLNYINSPENKIAETEIRNYLNRYETGDVRHETNLKSKISYLKSNIGIYDLCETIIRIFELNKSKHVNPSLSFFLDAVHEYSVKNPNNIPDFLTWWEEKKGKLSLIVPDELDAVKIMTIHKAKGLQFPVVIFPFATERQKNTKDSLWVDLDESEIPKLKVALLKNSSKLDDTIYTDLYNTESAKSYLDLVNILYVTLTRAEERIYVLTKKPSKESKAQKSIPDMFAEYFKSKGEWDENKFIYTYGETKKELRNENPDKIGTGGELRTKGLNELISNDWKKEIIIRAQAPETWDTENPEQNRQYGNLVHTALSRIKYSEDMDNAIDSLVSDGLIDDKERKELTSTLSRFFNNSEIRQFFQKEEGTVIKSEAEILSAEGKVYRPDRLILKGEKVVLLEFKTGKQEDYHIKQIKLYDDLLKGKEFKEIEKYLIYIEECKVQRIDN